MKACIFLRSGGTVEVDGDALTCDVSEVRIAPDILGSYGEIGRFGGQAADWTDYHHVQLGCELLGADHPFLPQWILHEAGEALGVGDVNFRLKPENLRAVDEMLMNAVIAHAGLEPISGWKEFKEFDLALGRFESLKLFPPRTWRKVMRFYGFDPMKYPWPFDLGEADKAFEGTADGVHAPLFRHLYGKVDFL